MTGSVRLDETLTRYRIDRSSEAFIARFGGAIELGIAAIKGLFIVNGGALVALFTLLGQHEPSDPAQLLTRSNLLWWAFASFVAGLAAAVLGALCTFWSQVAWATYEHEFTEYHFDKLLGGSSREVPDENVDHHNRLLIGGSAALLLSLTAFGLGSGLALKAATTPRPHMAQHSASTALPALPKAMEKPRR